LLFWCYTTPQTTQRLRAARRSKESPQYTSVLHCLEELVKDNGLMGLLRGLDAKLLQTVIMAAFKFLTYEQILNVQKSPMVA